jgi:hypothetical protein
MDATVLGSILAVFDAVGEWFSTFVPTLFALFWTPGAEGAAGELTFLGVLAVAGLAISVVFLVMGLIQNFLHFRG